MDQHPIPRWLGILLLLAVALSFASNHISARISFDQGTSVSTAVAVRSVFTAVLVFVLMRIQGVSLTMAKATRVRAAIIGVLLAVQSFCLYSAVARIPVALALLTFNTFPILLAVMSWLSGGEKPSRTALIAMPFALIGLSLVLDIFGSGNLSGRWTEIGAGVGWAISAAAAFAGVLFLTTRWLGDVDGRLRTFVTMCVASIVILIGGSLSTGFALPVSSAGWLGLALLSVFYGTAITVLFIVLPKIGAVNNSVVLNFEPICLLGLAWVILGQAVSSLQIFGAFIVVGAITFLTLRRN